MAGGQSLAVPGRPLGLLGPASLERLGGQGGKEGLAWGRPVATRIWGWAPSRGSRGRSSPPLPVSGGSGHPSLGWCPRPSRLCLRLHVASPLCPCLSSCVSYKDLSLGLGLPSSGKDLISDPSLCHLCRDRFQIKSCSAGPFELTAVWTQEQGGPFGTAMLFRPQGG